MRLQILHSFIFFHLCILPWRFSSSISNSQAQITLLLQQYFLEHKWKIKCWAIKVPSSTYAGNSGAKFSPPTPQDSHKTSQSLRDTTHCPFPGEWGVRFFSNNWPQTFCSPWSLLSKAPVPESDSTGFRRQLCVMLDKLSSQCMPCLSFFFFFNLWNRYDNNSSYLMDSYLLGFIQSA